MIKQEFTSAKTSINSKRLPAIYNKLDWAALWRDSKTIPPIVLDIGAGRHIAHIKEFIEGQGFSYAPYDPYNLPKAINATALSLKPSVVICSNVFNVIKEKEIHYEIHRLIRDKNCPFFITIYEGDKSLAGSPTKIAKASDKVRKGAGEKVTPDSPEDAVSYIVGKLNEKHAI